MSKSTVTPEALAASVETAPVPTRSADDIAAELAPYLRGSSDLFGACRVAYVGIVESGQTAQAIADASTVALATLIYPATNSAAHKFALTESVTKGGAKVTRVAIDQRKNAWGDIIRAGIDTPTEQLVEASYKLATTGGSAEPRQRVIVAVSKLPASKRADAFLKKATEALTALRRDNKERTAERAATKSADSKADASPRISAESMGDVQVVVAYLNAIAQHNWSEVERAAISDAIADLSVAFAEEHADDMADAA